MKLRVFICLYLMVSLAAGGVCFAEEYSCRFYEHFNYERGYFDKEGEAKDGHLSGGWNDQIDSIRVAPCYKVTLFGAYDYNKDEGWDVFYAGSYPNLDNVGDELGDDVSSYIIERVFDMTELGQTEGSPGDWFVIRGKGFAYPGVDRVEMGDEDLNWRPVELSNCDLVIGGCDGPFANSDEEIEVQVGNQSGKVTVVSTKGCEVTSTETFTVCPKISSLALPVDILPGVDFTVNGSGFVGVNNVKIGDESVGFTIESTNKITVTAGEKSGKVTVITDLCEVVSDESLTVPEAGYTYYDIGGNVIESSDLNLIEKNAVMRVNQRDNNRIEYALEIGHDFTESELSGGYFENYGNPSPTAGKHWYEQGAKVTTRIDGQVYEASRRTRHVATGYTLFTGSGGAFTDQTVTFPGAIAENHAFTVAMNGPKKIYFRWKTQHRIQVSAIPAEMGDLLWLDGPEDRSGAGAWWYDAGARLVSSAGEGCLKRVGYRDSVNNQTDPVPESEVEIALDQPIQIIWQYETHNYDLTVAVGDPVDLSGVAPDVLDRTDTQSEPRVTALSDDPAGGGDDVAVWSPADKKLYPLIGGRTFEVEWENKSDSECPQKLVTTVSAEWPRSPHYEHVAETPPTPLDPKGDDRWAFVALKYAEKDAQVSPELAFTASKAGKSTLLFTRTGPGTAAAGDLEQESAYVRVVETRPWNVNKGTADVQIGEEITSGHHDARTPHNGYVFWEKARYNANLYDRQTLQGPIFPVNRQFTASPSDDLLVIWYKVTDNISWPFKPVAYTCDWPGNTGRIVVASREGGECRNADGADPTWPDANGDGQNYLDPARYKEVTIYQQPDPQLPGYNPNEEHAVTADSFRHGDMAAPPTAAFALRNDLNITTQDETYTSDPYVLIQYYDLVESRHAMAVFSIDLEDPDNGYVFEYPMKAGDPLVAPYPLNQVIGAAPPSEISGRNGQPGRNCYWEDHKGQSWAVSGDAHLFAYFWYPLDPTFWYEKDHNGNDAAEAPGDPVPWLPTGVVTEADVYPMNDHFPAEMEGRPKAVEVRYDTIWPEETPVLKAGETLTFAGGEYRADHPQTPEGLPMVLGWAAGQVIFDELNPNMDEEKMFDGSLVRLVQALEERTVDLPVEKMPEDLTPAAGKVKVEGGRWYFKQLHAGLKSRVFYDPLTGRLGIRGFVNGKTLGDDDLTASPPSVYVLQPNILTEEEKDTLRSLEGADDHFKEKVEDLYSRTRNPGGFEGRDYTVGISDAVLELATLKETLFEDQYNSLCGSLHSLCPSRGFDYLCGQIPGGNADPRPYPAMALGPGLALIPSAALLDPGSPIDSGYVTVAENNHPSLGGLPVALHIIKVVKDKYRGALQTVYSDNVFDEKITLRHTADFGANPDNIAFEWYYREEDGTEQPPPDTAPAGTWQVFPGDGPEVAMTGAGAALLRDNLFFCRYRYSDENTEPPTISDWSDWAGAANSRPPKDDEDPVETFQPMLAEGWVKRVINGINPFEARIQDFYNIDSPATYSSMIEQAGPRFEGAVAFNPDKDVIENIGLIELYNTVLNRARDLSIDLEQPEGSSGVYTALLLAASRISGFYTLLGNEAYTDALDPTIGFGAESVEYGSLAPTIFTFMNQVPTLLDEELALLRGRSEEGARPVYNRLLWNFTKAEGEAAYALSYNLQDVNKDGFIDEADGRALYPQGHGDAWGHYLTALKGYYDLLGHDQFNWEARSEIFQIEGVVLDVDYLDERKFAETAAAKAKTGKEIVNLTYRSRYVEDPEGQWQGYQDTNRDRAWGLEGWGHRAASGALFDWAVANMIIPSSVSFKLTQADIDQLKRDDVPQGIIDGLYGLMDRGFRTEADFSAAMRDVLGEEQTLEYGDSILELADNEGLKRIDRTTVPDLEEIASQARQVQQEYDHANAGLTPLGLATDAVPFDIDPSRMIPGAYNAATHFEQAHEKAMKAMDNARVVFDHANDLKNRIRQVANDTQSFTEQVRGQDRDYRNRLIEIFGTPYEGTIGAGKVYPAGYKGPDYFLYMYVDVNEVSEETVPPPSDAITAYFDPMDRTFVDKSGEAIDDTEDVEGISTLFSHFFDTDLEESAVTAGDFSETLEIEFPMSAGKYSFQAPSEWGLRRSPGEVQQALIELVKAEADLQLTLADYAGILADIQFAADLLEARSDLHAEELRIGKEAQATTRGFNYSILYAKKLAAGYEFMSGLVEDTAETVIKGLPTVVGTSSDPSSVARMTTTGTANTASYALKFSAFAAETAAEILESEKELAQMVTASNINKANYKYEVQQQLKEIETLMGNEAPGRLAVFKAKEHMRQVSEKYRAVLARGLRLMEERKAFNAKVAAKTQGKRYMDMAFRVNLNDALSKYRSMFDLAARYAYLAAKAYDYETNLSGGDPASARPLLTEIVKKRTLGQYQDDRYVVGRGGLGDILARLDANYDALKGQMGFNNPQTETGRFSLRYEKFRVKQGAEYDDEWRRVLQSHQVGDLWGIPEFRKYCRPFTQESAGFQPGIVIPFETNVIFGRNFFGWPLGGGDHAYDPTNFATKVRSVGVWFEGYDNSRLSETPRAYLIPAGMDVMLTPDSTELDTREWTVVDQKLPVPLPVGESDLNNPDWIPSLDSLNGAMAKIRKFSSFRAYHDAGYFDASQMSYDSRLVGRSVWNSRWMLIIPGGTFNYDSKEGLETFINTVTDIRLFFETYAISGN